MSNETTEETQNPADTPTSDSNASNPPTPNIVEEPVETSTPATAVPAGDSAPTDTDSAARARSRVLIGSQRDPANPELTPHKPKAVREAANRAMEASTSQPKIAETPQPQPAPIESSVEQPRPEEPATVTSVIESASETSSSVEVPISETTHAETVDDTLAEDVPQVIINPLVSQDLEQEINDALGDLSLDEIMATGGAAATGEELDEDSRHKGTVVKIHREDVFFTLGGRHEGVVSLKLFKNPPKLGAMMDVVVRGFNADEGLYDLSIPGASVTVADWSDLAEGAVVEARVTGSNTGGLECMVNNIRGFIPASQIATHRVENLSEFINQKLQCVVTEAKPRRRNLVLSHRAVMEREQEEKRQGFLETLEPGQIVEGTVSSIRDFGAFVDIGGVDGLIHISKLSWDHVKDPNEVLKAGQRVRVKVEKINKQTGKIGLSYRDLLEHPWENVEQKYTPNSIVNGTISRIAKFGAFCKLEPGIEGMIHISELAHHRVLTVSNIVNEGDTVEVKVLTVDREAQRIALSLKATQAAPDPKQSSKPEEAADEPARDLAVPRRKGPLKGGKDKPSGGEQFGLKW